MNPLDDEIGATRRHLQRLLNRLPGRERDEAEVLLAVQTLPYEEGIDRLRGFVDRWPDYPWGWFYLGDNIFHHGFLFGQHAGLARHYIERALGYAPESTEMAFHLADFLAREGDFDRLDSLERAHGGLRFGLEKLDALMGLFKGDEERFRRDRQKVEALSVQSLMRSVAGLTFYDRIAEARIIKEIIESRSDVSEFNRKKLVFWEGLIDLIEGRTARGDSILASISEGMAIGLPFLVMQAVNPFHPTDTDRTERLRTLVTEWDTARSPIGFMPTGWPSNLERGRYEPLKFLFEALLAYHANDAEALRRAVSQLRTLGKRDDRKGKTAHVYERTLEAIRLKDRGEAEAALQVLASVRGGDTYGLMSPIRNQSFQRLLTAEILFSEGRYEEALPWYRSINEIGWEVPWGGQFLGPIYYRRAQIHEQLGEDEQALQYYGKFMDLWKDADPELQVYVEDARAHREALLERQVREPAQ